MARPPATRTHEAPSSKRQRGLAPDQSAGSSGGEWRPRLPSQARPADRPAAAAWAPKPATTGPVAGAYPRAWPTLVEGRQTGARGPKPVITVDDIVDLPPDWHMGAPDVSGIDGRLLERVSKYLTFAARHDIKTLATADGFIMLSDLIRKAQVVRAFSSLEKSGVPVTSDVIAAIALYLSEASKLRFEIKISPTRGLCLRAIAGHSSVLDPCRKLPSLRPDEARRIATAIHCTSWENVESILTSGLFSGNAVGGVRSHIHLTTFPIRTSGFAQARGARPVAVALDLVKCLHRGVKLFVAGGETLLTTGAPITTAAGLQRGKAFIPLASRLCMMHSRHGTSQTRSQRHCLTGAMPQSRCSPTLNHKGQLRNQAIRPRTCSRRLHT